MFEFIENVARDIINDLNNSVIQMNEDAAAYDEQARKNEQIAIDKEAETKREEASIHHYKTIVNTVIDDEGNSTETTEKIVDTEADAISIARARTLRIEAVKLKAIAATLKSLAAALRVSSSAISNQKKKFDQETMKVQTAISFTSELLNSKINTIQRTIALFDIPEVNNIKDWSKNIQSGFTKISSAKLLDGLNDELYKKIDYITKLNSNIGAKLTKRITSFACETLGNIYGEKFKNNLNDLSGNVINKYFSNNSANYIRDKIVSGLFLLGINANPTLNLMQDDIDMSGLYISNIEEAEPYFEKLIESGYVTEDDVNIAMSRIKILKDDDFKEKYKTISGGEDCDKISKTMRFQCYSDS